MMSFAVMEAPYINRRMPVNGATNCVVDGGYGIRQLMPVLNTDEILAMLDERGIRNVDIARALGLPDSRVPEIKTKKRALKLDEAVKLDQAFGLAPDRPVPPLPAAVSRLIVRYVAEELGVAPDEAHLVELTEDLRAFSEFVADPRVRRSLDAAESFFQAMRLRRPKSEPGVEQQNAPHRAQ